MSEQYFTADPASAEQRRRVVAPVWGRRLELDTGSGVFAFGRLDLGTAVLFRQAQPPSFPGRFLDLGCGYGAIACGLATAVPGAEVWAVDINRRALSLCRDNARRLAPGAQVTVCEPDAVPAGLVFDEIWSNPPIRVGKQALHALLLHWLPRLAPEGRAVLVVGRNLGADSLQRWLVEQEHPCVRLGSAKGFRVLEVRRPPIR